MTPACQVLMRSLGGIEGVASVRRCACRAAGPCRKKHMHIRGLPKMGVPFLGVPIKRITVCRGIFRGTPIFWEMPICVYRKCIGTASDLGVCAQTNPPRCPSPEAAALPQSSRTRFWPNWGPGRSESPWQESTTTMPHHMGVSLKYWGALFLGPLHHTTPL